MTEHNQQSALLGKIAAYTELLVNDPRSTIFVSLAETYRKLGLFEDARDIVNKGLELHPDFGPAYVVLARIECQLDHFDASCAAFERALNLDQDNLAALVGYARVKLLMHRPEDARELLLRARTLSPADPVINKMLLGLSATAQKKEEHPPAPVITESSKQTLSSLASTTLADLYMVQGFTDKALGLYRQLLSSNPDDLDLRRKIKELESREEQVARPDEKGTETLYDPADNVEPESDDGNKESRQQHLDRDVDTQRHQDAAKETGPGVSDSVLPAETLVAAADDQPASDPLAQPDQAPPAVESAITAEVSAPDAVETFDADIEMSEPLPADTGTSGVAHDTNGTIEILNQWLDTIRKRREHV